jgi:hypothetical protein
MSRACASPTGIAVNELPRLLDHGIDQGLWHGMAAYVEEAVDEAGLA